MVTLKEVQIYSVRKSGPYKRCLLLLLLFLKKNEHILFICEMLVLIKTDL